MFGSIRHGATWRTVNLRGDWHNYQHFDPQFLYANRFPRRMLIALVTDGLFPMSIGGMQSHSTNLARSLASAGVDVDLIYPGENDQPASEVPARIGLPPERLRLFPVRWPVLGAFPGHYVVELWRYSTQVRRLLANRRDIDWVYVQGLCGLALMTGHRSELPPIAVNLHGLEMFQRAPSFRDSVHQLLLRPPARFSARNADLSVSLGGGTTRILRSLGVPQTDIEEIPVGIDSDWLVDLPRPVHEPRRLLFVGRYERRKGIAELSASVQALRGTNEFAFDFVGPIPVERQVRAPGIKYWGTVSDRGLLREIMDRCDVIVCPSYAEGMPTVILEGMARGLAVIATEVGAVDELVSSSNGWLIQPSDPAALTFAIQDSLSIADDELYEKKLASLSRIDGKFRWDQVARRTAGILTSRARPA